MNVVAHEGVVELHEDGDDPVAGDHQDDGDVSYWMRTMKNSVCLNQNWVFLLLDLERSSSCPFMQYNFKHTVLIGSTFNIHIQHENKKFL